MNTHLPAVVAFDDQTLTIYDHAGQPWLAARDLARALDYADTSAVTRIHAAHADEFTEAMTLTVKTTARGQAAPTPVRLFSPRGCHLIAMFARTPRAAAFRRWVLDVLEHLGQPEPATTQALDVVDAEAVVWMRRIVAQAAPDTAGLVDALIQRMDDEKTDLTDRQLAMIQARAASLLYRRLRTVRHVVGNARGNVRAARLAVQHAERTMVTDLPSAERPA